MTDAMSVDFRPPAEHADKPLHWVHLAESDCPPRIWEWAGGCWLVGDAKIVTRPDDPLLRQYRYLGVAEKWTPEGNDARIAALEAENTRLATKLADREEPVVSGEMVPYEQLRAMAQCVVFWCAEADKLKAELRALRATYGERPAVKPIPARVLRA